MRFLTRGSIALALICAAALGTPAEAQSIADEQAQCINAGSKFSMDAQIAACSAIVARGQDYVLGIPNALYNRGNGYLSTGDKDRAFADYDAAIRLDPKFPRAFLARGDLYYARGDKAHAMADFNEAIRQSPAFSDALFSRSRAYRDQGDYVHSLADSREVARLLPDNAVAQSTFCYDLILSNGALDQARVACDAALRLKPNDSGMLARRGLLSLKQGRFQDAWTDFDAGVRLNPKAAVHLYGRGIAELRLGRASEGNADIAAATALNPKIGDGYSERGIRP